MNWAYVAGFFDGEGCLSTKRDGTVGFSVAISQTNFEVLSGMQLFLAASGIRSAIHDRQKYMGFGRKRQWVLRLDHRESVRRFLLGILPYVVVKRVQVLDCVRFMRMYPAIAGILSGERLQRIAKLRYCQ